MNFYEHHLGDYAEATSHLSFLEDAAYSRMIRKYYSTEKPLPLDLKAVQRLVGARTPDECEAVDVVLREFFVQHDDGWHNARCDLEIERYADKRVKARASAQLSLQSRGLSARASAERPQSERSTGEQLPLNEGTASVQKLESERSALQSPVPSPQSPDSNREKNQESRGARAARSAATRLPDGFELTPERAKIAATENLAPERTFEKFRDYWRAKSGADARKLDWDATWRNWCRNEADRLPPHARTMQLSRRPKTADELDLEATRVGH